MPCWSGKPGACTRRLALEDEGRFQSSPLPESRAVDVSVDPERAKELSLVESVEASICCKCCNRSATGRRARSTKKWRSARLLSKENLGSIWLAVRQASHCKSLTYVGEYHSVRICFRVASLRKMHLDGLDFVRLDLNANHVILYRKVSGWLLHQVSFCRGVHACREL
jgi:hypothetical protein